jgi:hypothetical protein
VLRCFGQASRITLTRNFAWPHPENAQPQEAIENFSLKGTPDDLQKLRL